MEVEFLYTGVRVKDLKKSIEFYTRLLKMKVEGRQKISETKGEVVSLVSRDGGFQLELNHYSRGSRYEKKYTVGEALDHLAFKVEDIDALLAEVTKMGFHQVEEVRTKRSRWAYVKDPNGIWIELCQ